MGKHYTDPLDKPTLAEQSANGSNVYPSSYGYLQDVCSGCVRRPEQLTVHQGPESDADEVRRLYAVQVPENLINPWPAHTRFYFSWHGANNFLKGYNVDRVTKQNCGNKRRARLLVYTQAEMLEYLAQCPPINC